MYILQFEDEIYLNKNYGVTNDKALAKRFYERENICALINVMCDIPNYWLSDDGKKVKEMFDKAMIIWLGGST